ncbi:MAG: peptidase, partial [Bacteroidota bacterium]
MHRIALFTVVALALAVAGCSGPEALEITSVGSTIDVDRDPGATVRAEADAFLDLYTRGMLPLYYASALAEWDANTRIVEVDTLTAAKVRAANEAFAAYTGSVDHIERARGFLERRDALTELQTKQLEAVLYAAAQNPQTVPDLVRERIAAEAAQNDALFGYTFTLYGEEITPNEIARLLRESDDLDEREQVWLASKEVGPTLTPGLESLRGLRNQTVQALGYDDYFTDMMMAKWIGSTPRSTK